MDSYKPSYLKEITRTFFAHISVIVISVIVSASFNIIIYVFIHLIVYLLHPLFDALLIREC